MQLLDEDYVPADPHSGLFMDADPDRAGSPPPNHSIMIDDPTMKRPYDDDDDGDEGGDDEGAMGHRAVDFLDMDDGDGGADTAKRRRL